MPIFLRARDPDYVDLDLTFSRNRVTGDVSVLTGFDAIKQSIINLVLTNFYEKPFRPTVGSNVNRLLFENGGPLVVTFLQQAIAEVITNYEPRAALIQVIVTPIFAENSYKVDIWFSVKNVLEPQEVSFFLQRIR